MTNALKIIALPVDEGGCGNYRVRQPLKMVTAHTAHDTHIVDLKSDAAVQVTKAMATSDIGVVRQGGEAGVRELRTIPEFGHLKWVLDIDDNIELISPYSQHYQEYGTEEFYDQNAKAWLWKDGEQGFNVATNRAKVASLLQGMREADLVTVTTETLAAYARQYNDRVAVLPNLIDTSAWWPLPLPIKEEPRTLRIGWSGGVSHYEDWYTISKPLNELMAKHHFTLVSVGAHFAGIVAEKFRKRVEVRPWVPFAAHSYRMMCLDLDAAIIPLADMPFNTYKSPIKWLEFAAMAVPAVVAGVTPYKEEVKDGHTALTYDSPERFYDQLERLLTSPLLRLTLGNNARSWVVNNRDAKANAHLWPDAYARILT